MRLGNAQLTLIISGLLHGTLAVHPALFIRQAPPIVASSSSASLASSASQTPQPVVLASSASVVPIVSTTAAPPAVITTTTAAVIIPPTTAAISAQPSQTQAQSQSQSQSQIGTLPTAVPNHVGGGGGSNPIVTPPDGSGTTVANPINGSNSNGDTSGSGLPQFAIVTIGVCAAIVVVAIGAAVGRRAWAARARAQAGRSSPPPNGMMPGLGSGSATMHVSHSHPQAHSHPQQMLDMGDIYSITPETGAGGRQPYHYRTSSQQQTQQQQLYGGVRFVRE